MPLILTALAAAMALFSLTPNEVRAQSDRYVAFVHGLTFGDDSDDPRTEKGVRWRKSGTIEAWENAGVMGSENYAVLTYYDEKLYDETNLVMGRLVDQMMSQTDASADARWVLVGHSQGGIVVRLLYEYIQANRPDINVEGVMAIASPLQGARAAKISWDGEGSYYSVSSEIINFLQDVLGAPAADSFEDAFLAAGIQPYGGNRWIELASNFVDFYGLIADRGIKILAEADRGLNVDNKIDAISYDKGGAAAIAPGGYLIRQINHRPTPDQYRALIGAERYPVPFRVWSGASTEQAKTSFPWLPLLGIGGGVALTEAGFPSLGTLFFAAGNFPNIRPGNEPIAVKYFHSVHLQYVAMEQFYDSQNSAWDGIFPDFWSECWDGDGYNPCVRQDRWNDGENAIESFPALYSQLIDSYKLERRTNTYQKTVCPDIYGSGYRVSGFTPPTAQEYVDFHLEPPGDDDDPYDRNEPNECWKEWVTDVYYVTVPDENDGIVSVQTGTWSENGSPNDRVHNFLFGDNGNGPTGTGYNHAEMVYAERHFSSANDPAHYNVSFTRGMPNPPMVNAQDWIIEEVFGGPE